MHILRQCRRLHFSMPLASSSALVSNLTSQKRKFFHGLIMMGTLSTSCIFTINAVASSVEQQTVNKEKKALIPKQALTLKQAVIQSLKVHPDLKAFAYKAQAQKAMITQSGISSPLMFNAKVEDAFGSGEFSDISAVKTNLSIAWLMEDEQINARVKLANNQAQLVAFEKQTKALDIAAKTASIYIVLLAQKEQLTLAKLALNYANTAYSEVQKRVESAKAHVVDEYRAKANVAQKALEVEDLTHEIEASKAKLSAQWQGLYNGGDHQPSEFVAVDTLASIPSVMSFDKAYQQLKAHPKFKVLAAQARITSSAVALAKANEQPAWQISAGLKHDNINDDVGLTAGISIPFGSENRNQGQILQLQAKQKVNQAQTDAWQKHATTQLLLVSHQLKHNRHVIEGLTNDVIPALESANNEAENAYQLGRYRYSEWYDVQQALIEAQFELISAYANVHQLSIEMQRLTGTELNISATL